MFKVMKSPAAYQALSGLGGRLTVQWNCALMQIINTHELTSVMEAAGHAERYAMTLRDSGVISELQRTRMVQMANVVTANKVQRLGSEVYSNQ